MKWKSEHRTSLLQPTTPTGSHPVQGSLTMVYEVHDIQLCCPHHVLVLSIEHIPPCPPAGLSRKLPVSSALGFCTRGLLLALTSPSSPPSHLCSDISISKASMATVFNTQTQPHSRLPILSFPGWMFLCGPWCLLMCFTIVLGDSLVSAIPLESQLQEGRSFHLSPCLEQHV